MRYFQMLLICIFLMAGLPACQSAAPTGLVPQSTEAQIVTPTRASEDLQTPPPTSTLTAEDTDMVTPLTPEAAAQKMVALAKEHLAKRLGIAVEQIVLSDVKPVRWQDAGLGCSKPGVDYIRAETPGYNISLEADGKTYSYHTDEVNRIVLCSKP